MPRRSVRRARAAVDAPGDELGTELNASEGSNGGGATGSDSASVGNASEGSDGSRAEAAAGTEDESGASGTEAAAVVGDAPVVAAVEGVHRAAAAVPVEAALEGAGDWASESEDEAVAGDALLGVAADYLLLAQPVLNVDPEQPALVGNLAPEQPAPIMANIVAPQPTVQFQPGGAHAVVDWYEFHRGCSGGFCFSRSRDQRAYSAFHYWHRARICAVANPLQHDGAVRQPAIQAGEGAAFEEPQVAG